MSKTRHNLPDNLNPTGDKCYPLFIPDDPQWNQYIIRAIRTLTFDRHWQRDDNDGQDALSVREQWFTRTYLPFIDALENGTICQDKGLGSCFRMDTTTDAFSFYPNDPFTDPQNNDGNVVLTQMKWKRFAEIGLNSMPIIGDFAQSILEDVTGYFPNDIILTFESIEVLNPVERLQDIIGQFTNFPFPYVRIEIEGAGQIEIEVLNFPFGGYVMLIPDLPVDENFNIDFGGVLDTILGFVDDGFNLPKGWISLILDRKLPIELIVSQIQEFEFEADGQHTLHAIFCPRPSITPPFLNPFGGIREIEACGDIKIIGVTTGNTIDKTNFKQSDMVRDGIITVATTQEICDGMICAMETVAQRILLATEAGNILSGVEIDPDTGAVTVKQTSDTGNVAIDGAAEEKHYGGVYYQALQFKKLLDDINSNITSGYAVDTIINLSRIFINPADLAAWTSLVTSYNTGTARPVINADQLALNLFCDGVSSGVLNYAIAQHSGSEDELNAIIDFASEIPNGQWGAWYDKGQRTPRQGYQSSTCYRLPQQTKDWTSIGTDTTLAVDIQFIQSNRLKRVTISGQITDADGRVFDGFYFKDTDGTITYNGVVLRSGVSTNFNPNSIPVYNSKGGYSVEYDVVPAASIHTIFVVEGTPAIYSQFNAPTGKLTITLIDLGSL